MEQSAFRATESSRLRRNLRIRTAWLWTLGGNLHFAEWSRVRKITPDGIITTVAGTTARAGSNNGCSPPASPGCGPPPVGDGQAANSVQLFGPTRVAVDSAGNLYFVDGPRIREVTPDGIISTVLGNGSYTGYHGFTGDGGPATSAPLWAPNGVTVDNAGNLYISEPVRIRKVTTDHQNHWGHAGTRTFR